jgi:hypothetical protein
LRGDAGTFVPAYLKMSIRNSGRRGAHATGRRGLCAQCVNPEFVQDAAERTQAPGR